STGIDWSASRSPTFLLQFSDIATPALVGGPLGTPRAPPDLAEKTPSRQRQTRREAGTQSHGSGREPDSRVTERRRRTPREHWWSPRKEEINVFGTTRWLQLRMAHPHLGRVPPDRDPG